MSLKFNFEGKVVLITGSSSGIGASTAILFTKSGANVVVTGRNAYNIKKVAKLCLKDSKNDTKLLEVIADLTKEEDAKRLIDETIKTFGKLDILVNNAGAGFKAKITESDYIQKFRKTLDTNLNSLVLLTHLSVKHLKKTKGNLINISSIASLRSGKNASTYSVAKVGIDMFSHCMAAELGPKGIRVNVINPGTIKSNFFQAMGYDQVAIKSIPEKMGRKLPMGRVGECDDIAYAIMFLASNESSFLTGSNLISDGGHLASNVNFG